jgi:hypothetical protein
MKTKEEKQKKKGAGRRRRRSVARDTALFKGEADG